MICLICRHANLFDGFTSITLEQADIKVMVSGVPAWICPNCGDAVVDENVALRLLATATAVAGLGMRRNSLKYADIVN